MEQFQSTWAPLLYLVAGILFILALRGLSSPATSQKGNRNGMIGMTIAVGTTLALLWNQLDPVTWGLIIGAVAIGGTIGAIIARRIPMTDMPQLVAAFHSLVGMAAVLVAAAALYAPDSFGIAELFMTTGDPSTSSYAVNGIKTASLIELGLGSAIGALTFTGSVIAFAKLNGNMSGAPILLPARHVLNLALGAGIIALTVILILSHGTAHWAFWGLTALALILGITLIIPIGGADMPVVVSMLNSYSGWAAAALGFTLGNFALIITGALVGSSGAILSYIMCKGMNRSFISVILGGFGGEDAAAAGGAKVDRPYKKGSAEDAAFIMKNASKVIIVPGYGMAVAQAQHALKEMAEKLKEEGVEVKYAIHPVAGRMPGHMNVLLAEAQVPYDEVFELEDINSEFSASDVAFVIGANDVTNPAAKTDKTSPIYGMPILDVENARTVLFIKRSMGSGYAGIENELFFHDNTMMLLADAKKMVEDIVKNL
ncbi:NAD(P)(+) transhydrogenase (Re/Si-specific) subunit beta [Hyphomonas sp.]|uniref:NAD(P)(+) transhydrogenase (Re/Si-specific) subunit beta n=1 Tax=Hyphomonas sp. TaxID=87 RepID=UPI00391D6CBF